MAYVLELINNEIREKIISDGAELRELRVPSFGFLIPQLYFPERDQPIVQQNWAIDHESGNYLVAGGGAMERFNIYFFIFNFEGKSYLFGMLYSHDDTIVAFREALIPMENRKYHCFMEELRRAFQCYGMVGRGFRSSDSVLIPRKVKLEGINGE